jgi:hypothetical protein
VTPRIATKQIESAMHMMEFSNLINIYN